MNNEDSKPWLNRPRSPPDINPERLVAHYLLLVRAPEYLQNILDALDRLWIGSHPRVRKSLYGNLFEPPTGHSQLLQI